MATRVPELSRVPFSEEIKPRRDAKDLRGIILISIQDEQRDDRNCDAHHMTSLRSPILCVAL